MAKKGKRLTRMGSKDVAKAFTLKRKEARIQKQLALEGAGNGGLHKRKPSYARPDALQALQVVEANRWPDDEQLVKYHELNQDKKKTGGRRKPRKNLPPVEFPLMDEINPVIRNRMLIAASLKVKEVKRLPGFILQRTYNHKKRPITFV